MSRTEKKTKGPGYEYWSKRPVSNAHGAVPGTFTKRRTAKIERQQGKKDIRANEKDFKKT
jgi:hypothetical protein